MAKSLATTSFFSSLCLILLVTQVLAFGENAGAGGMNLNALHSKHTEDWPFDEPAWCPPSWAPDFPFMPTLPGCRPRRSSYYYYYQNPYPQQPSHQPSQPSHQPSKPRQPFKPPQPPSDKGGDGGEDCSKANNIISSCTRKDSYSYSYSYSWSYSFDDKCCTAVVSSSNLDKCNPNFARWLSWVRSQCPHK